MGQFTLASAFSTVQNATNFVLTLIFGYKVEQA